MLPEPHASEVKKLLRDYVELRVELTRGSQSSISLEQTVGRSNEIQAELWQHAIAVNAADPLSTATGLFVRALNEMIDLQETRLAARLNRVPAVVFALLYAIAMVAIGLSGYVGGLGESEDRADSGRDHGRDGRQRDRAGRRPRPLAERIYHRRSTGDA
jgi:hypothetical protein